MITTILCSVNLIAYGEIADLKGEYYEKDGCIYIIGHPTEEEKNEQDRVYKTRMVERIKQLEIERQRRHEVKIETIKAQAMRDYLIAQGIPLREVADALGKLKIRQNVVIGKIVAMNYNTNTDENTNDNKTEIDINVKK